MNKISQYTDIPGFGEFGDIYKEIVLALPDNAAILEIGVAFGRGTWAMLDAMRNNMTLCVVDRFRNNSYELFNEVLQLENPVSTMSMLDCVTFAELSKMYSQREMFLHSVEQHRNYKQLQTIYTMPSNMYISSKHPATYDLVFLDGDHSYETVKQELEYFKDCRVISGHDYDNHTWPGVKKAVHEFMTDYPGRSLRIYDDQFVFVLSSLKDSTQP